MRTSTRRIWIGALCVLVLAGQPAGRARGERQDQTQPVTLAPSLKAGDAVQYRTSLSMSVNGSDIMVEQNRKHTVKEIKDNGELVIVVTDLGGKVNFNGSDRDTPPGTGVTITQTKLGKILAYKPESDDNRYLSASALHLIALVNGIVFPDKPVEPGDSWTTEVDNPQVKDKKVSIKTTYVGTSKAGELTAWKVTQTVEADTDTPDSKLKAEMTALLDPANGQIIEADQTVKGIPGNTAAFDWKSKIRRVKADAEKKPAAP